MANPGNDPQAFLLQAALSPTDPHLEASPIAVEVIQNELARMADRAARLEIAMAQIKARMSRR